MAIKSSTNAKLLLMVDHAIAHPPLLPPEASSIFSKAQYIFSLGPFGRGVLQPVLAAMHAEDRGETQLQAETPYEDGILDSLRQTIAEGPPVVIFDFSPAITRPCLIWSDASSNSSLSRLAWIALIPSPDGDFRLFFAATAAPRRVLEDLQTARDQTRFITPLEEVAIAAAYCSPEVLPLLEDRHVIHSQTTRPPTAAS